MNAAYFQTLLDNIPHMSSIDLCSLLKIPLAGCHRIVDTVSRKIKKFKGSVVFKPLAIHELSDQYPLEDLDNIQREADKDSVEQINRVFIAVGMAL